jgi:hypothetical protein
MAFRLQVKLHSRMPEHKAQHPKRRPGEMPEISRGREELSHRTESSIRLTLFVSYANLILFERETDQLREYKLLSEAHV